MRLYRPLSLCAAVLFAAVGLVFLFSPCGVLIFFNKLSGYWGMRPTPCPGNHFYLVLAVGYMYIVSMIAYLMYRYPYTAILPLLLCHAKAASSVLSFLFFGLQEPYPIYLVNGLVDGAIALIALYYYRKIKMKEA